MARLSRKVGAAVAVVVVAAAVGAAAAWSAAASTPTPVPPDIGTTGSPIQPSPTAEYWTPERIRDAKPAPMPDP